MVCMIDAAGGPAGAAEQSQGPQRQAMAKLIRDYSDADIVAVSDYMSRFASK